MRQWIVRTVIPKNIKLTGAMTDAKAINQAERYARDIVFWCAHHRGISRDAAIRFASERFFLKPTTLRTLMRRPGYLKTVSAPMLSNLTAARDLILDHISREPDPPTSNSETSAPEERAPRRVAALSD